MTDPHADHDAARPEGRPAPGTTTPEQADSGSRAAGSPSPGNTAAAGPDAADLEDRWRRALADLDNLRKRYDRELARERAAERDRVTAAFLPVLDTLDRALEHARSDPASIVDGVRSMREQALAVLAALGYPREGETGVPFDPVRHEVAGVVDADGAGVAPGRVVEVLRPGYGRPGHQLRPATVTVARPRAD
jgi:molecular chaperone GrpE